MRIVSRGAAVAVATSRLPTAVEYSWDLQAPAHLAMAPIHVNELSR
ncbi:uncharacterized protein METZ01_LOCUS300062 [marine metagenome]|uniref:Uncharacterized protein n=1 Tax=marine metagenome TaxID=408172 RepID=A0A382MFA2_9ZZZZ